MVKGYDPRQKLGRLFVPKYEIGDLLVQVSFLFNSNDKFFAFEIRTGKKSKDRYHKVTEAARYMSKLFGTKWGTPTKYFSPLQEQVTNNAGMMYRLWVFDNVEVVTYLCRGNGKTFYVRGIVLNKTIVSEKKTKASSLNISSESSRS